MENYSLSKILRGDPDYAEALKAKTQAVKKDKALFYGLPPNILKNTRMKFLKEPNFVRNYSRKVNPKDYQRMKFLEEVPDSYQQFTHQYLIISFLC